ncbi:LrgB family protein [Fictibacillus aquaticus]|uniref:Murein hydrolase effector protein LrgB n=1 Tax=Fictibacillus aquaticus TaxID=2021314 RepID=A0A235FBE7_9BACL|nr:LrgB family protein [Fictibacillus aquaticus]OYD58658.1 hypothetical protein CGZ90_01790 [Fictibacillus aquaticus]
MDELFFLFLTVAVFSLSSLLYNKKRIPLFIPVLTSTFFIGAILITLSVPYEQYFNGAHWISELLGPSIVALAYPLYTYRSLLYRNWLSILSGVFAGFFIGFFSVHAASALFSFSDLMTRSLYPKSVTTPVAMEIASATNGSPELASLFVVITGIIGAVISPVLFRLFNISSPSSRGISLGSSAHAIGTSKAAEYGEETAAYSSVAMALSCVVASVFIHLWVK